MQLSIQTQRFLSTGDLRRLHSALTIYAALPQAKVMHAPHSRELRPVSP